VEIRNEMIGWQQQGNSGMEKLICDVYRLPMLLYHEYQNIRISETREANLGEKQMETARGVVKSLQACCGNKIDRSE